MNERKKLSSFFGGSSLGTTGAAFTMSVSIRPTKQRNGKEFSPVAAMDTRTSKDIRAMT
jgi:hypothetical protein